MSDAKLIFGVVGGSVLLLILAVVGFSKLEGDSGVSGTVKEIQGEERLVLGDEEAKVTVVEFSDFQCPACRAAEVLVNQIRGAEGVRMVYRHMPLSTIHKNAQIAAEAAEAAHAQGKFWEYHDVLFERQDEWAEVKEVQEKLVEYAGELELDTEAFTKALEERTYEQLVKDDFEEGLRLGVNGTPTFFVNGLEVASNQLMSQIEAELSK